jgi:hypothetical protein
MPVLWQGHEAECYVLGTASNTEDTGVADAAYERTGMRVGNNGGGNLTSAPDWAPANEIWHRFNYKCDGGYSNGFRLWAVMNSSGQILAQIVCVSGAAQFQVWDGVALVNVGATFGYVGAGAKGRFDIHVLGGNPGQIDVYGGAPGSQALQLSTTGNYSSVVNMVRIYHEPASIAGGFWTEVAHEIVQTTPTLNATSEVEPPTSNGADVDGTGTYTNVDESSYSDTDYINFTAAGQHQSFKSAARTGTQAIVLGVTISCRAWYEAGGPTQIKPYIKIGGTRYYGSTFALTLTAKGYQYTWQTNPATSAAFTVTEVNDATLEWGWEAV